MFPQKVIHQYKAIFGTEHDVVVRAPGRINLIGEHTDYNQGYVLPAAIDRAIWFAAGRRTDGLLMFHALDLNDSFQLSAEEIRQQSGKGWVNYLLGVISEAQKDGLKTGGLNIVFGGDVPLGAGLSSSAAVESGMGFLMNELYQIGLEKMDIVKLALRAENKFVGMQCGIMDMFASVMGQQQQVIRLDCRSLEYEYFPFDTHEYAFVLCNSGIKHNLVDSEYNKRRRECEKGVAFFNKINPEIHSLRDLSPEMVELRKSDLPEVVYKRCKYVTEEIQRVEMACEALKSGDLVTLGRLMYQTHAGLQHEYEVSCPELDFLVDYSRKYEEVPGNNGTILGARMMGGGFGGCTLNLVKKTDSKAFMQFMQAIYYTQYNRELPCYEVHLTNGVEKMA